MDIGFRNVAIVAATALLLSCAYAQELPTAEMEKLSKPEILTIAKSGKPQELTIAFEASVINQELASKRGSISAKEEARSKATTEAEKIRLNDEILYDNNVAEANYVSELAALKSSVLSPLASLGVTVTQEYSHSSISLVKVPSFEALKSLLGNSAILKVSATEAVKVSAN